MGRANNISRSLIEISKRQGWDPTKIDGFGEFPNNDYPEDRATKGEQLHGPLPRDPQGECPHPSPPGPDNRGPGAHPRSKPGPNPYAGKSEAGA